MYLYIYIYVSIYIYMLAPPRSTFQTCQQMVEKHVGVRPGNVRCGLFTMKLKMSTCS